MAPAFAFLGESDDALLAERRQPRREERREERAEEERPERRLALSVEALASRVRALEAERAERANSAWQGPAVAAAVALFVGWLLFDGHRSRPDVMYMPRYSQYYPDRPPLR